MPKKTREPADPTSSPVAGLGYELRLLRQQAGLSYAAIAEAVFFAKSAVHAVDQGHTLPSESILRAFVEACGEDPQPWIERRAALAEELAAAAKESADQLSPRAQGQAPPCPQQATTAAAFNTCLKDLMQWSGLTYRQIAENSPPRARVAPSTLCGALGRNSLPSRRLVTGFLHAVGLPPPAQQIWLDTWQTIKSGRPAPPRAPILPTVQDLLGPGPDNRGPVPWGDWPRPRARLILQASPVPENTDLTPGRPELVPVPDDPDVATGITITTPRRIPDGDCVMTPYHETPDWTFHDGFWATAEPDGFTHRIPHRRRIILLARSLARSAILHRTTSIIAITTALTLLAALLATLLDHQQ